MGVEKKIRPLILLSRARWSADHILDFVRLTHLLTAPDVAISGFHGFASPKKIVSERLENFLAKIKTQKLARQKKCIFF